MIALGKDGTSVVYSTEDNATGVVDWMEVPLAGGEAKPFLADADIERIYVDPASGRLMGYLPRGTAKQPVLFDPAQQAVLRRVYRAFPKKDVAIVDWTPDFQFFLVNTSGNGDSGSYYLVDIAQRKADIVGEERPRIPPEQVGPISTFAYTASDGLAMDGILTLPPRREPKNLPVVILPHGGPTSHDIETFDWWAQAIASRGYAVFQPNFRGSTNRDDAFRRAGYGQWGRKMQTDLSDGLAELAKQGIVDAKRACIVGASYGGYAALAGVTLQQGIYRCAVAVAPVSDLSTMYNDDLSETNRSRMTRASLRESLGDPKAFDAVSPRRSAARADAPILLIHGKDDTVVPFKHSDAMASALRGAGKPFELVVLREEDHWLTRGATRLKMLEETMRFLKAHNPAD
jgi:dipeptidyl aminopeptidase/acylaminoacyl peptidase